MSKIRQHVPEVEGEIGSPEEADLRPYAIFAQLKADGPFEYAGWLDAADDAMALDFAREHYGQDQECRAIWAIPRGSITGTDEAFAPRDEPAGDERTFRVFVHRTRGDRQASAGTVRAASPAAALDAARSELRAESKGDEIVRVWVVPEADLIATDADDVIWRYTDQSYRLARGYSKDVRRKWEKVREERAITEYEKEDLHESF